MGLIHAAAKPEADATEAKAEVEERRVAVVAARRKVVSKSYLTVGECR